MDNDKHIKLDKEIMIKINNSITVFVDKIRVGKYVVWFYRNDISMINMDRDYFKLKYCSTLIDGTKVYDMEVKWWKIMLKEAKVN